jgi:predicted nucleic acid-binding Zn ribbon protein
MPYYKYLCINEECETEVFEKNNKMDDYQKPTPCPQCENECERWSQDFCKAPPVLLGTGWARDGYQIMKPVGNVLKRSDSAK